MAHDILTASQVVVTFDPDYERAYVWRHDPINGIGRMLGGIYTGSWNYGGAKKYTCITTGLSDQLDADTIGDAVHAILGVHNSL